MRKQELPSVGAELYSVLKYEYDQLTVLEKANESLVGRLRGEDFDGIPTLIEQRRFIEEELEKFDKQFQKLLPLYRDAANRNIDESISKVAEGVREKALRLSESYLTLVKMIEDLQKSVSQNLKQLRLGSRMIQSYHVNMNK